MAKYVLCPRCELNYMADGEEYCDICKAELKLGPQLVFAVDDDEVESGEKLCPICKRNYISIEDEMCDQCREEGKYDTVEEIDIEKDEEWRNFLDDDEKDLDPQDDEVISFSQLADEEKNDEFFRDDDEEEEEEEEIYNDEPDDFEDYTNINAGDFEEDEDLEEDDDEDDEDDDF